MGFETMELMIIQRKWNWNGHTLRRPKGDIAKGSLLEGNPQRSCKMCRPKNIWQRTIHQINITSVNIRPSRRRGRMTGQFPLLSFLWIFERIPFFITRHDALKKSFPFSPMEQFFTGKKRRSTSVINYKLLVPSFFFLNHGKGLAGSF